MSKHLQENILEIQTSLNIYSEDLIYKVCYWYSDKYDISFKKDDIKNELTIILKYDLEDLKDQRQLNLLEKEIHQKLLDQRVRQIISKETETIKQILLAKAFATHENFDEPPKGSFEDPLGFEL